MSELLTKDDLKYKDDYDWTATQGDDPSKTSLDKALFNRHEGYEVLALLNSFSNLDKSTLLEMEELIHEKLPSQIRSRDKVKDWLLKNI